MEPASSSYFPDRYGPGRDVRTDERGFRSEPVADEVPPGRVRIVCSGDSFTFGDGVAQDETWCHLLTTFHPALEVVNAGVSGYGVDQAFLRYLRDAASLGHQIHLFAYIDEDIRRAASPWFNGAPKPVLALERGRLVARNQPRQGIFRATEPLRRLRLFDFMLRTRARLFEMGLTRASESQGEMAAVLAAAIDSLARVSVSNGSELVVVRLPTPWLHGRPESSEWQRHIAAHADSAGVAFIDLMPAFQALSPAEAMAMTIQPHDQGPPGPGHLNETGHRWVADLLWRRLLELPRLRAVLEEPPGG